MEKKDKTNKTPRGIIFFNSILKQMINENKKIKFLLKKKEKKDIIK